ncbi:calcineurin-like phosphoesterase [Apiospora rasikravindrae]|uniref:Calcineurin-like phosphoesterase n=1 Tax=Apiospora rasikravindrae TaxID=990691 RepID=A0ABR1RSX4_9PEZI
MSVKTRILIVSDTHNQTFEIKDIHKTADIVIHCGDLSLYSDVADYQRVLDTMCQLPAPLKLCIAGNHDLGIDDGNFDKHLASKLDMNVRWGRNKAEEEVKKEFGPPGEPRRLLAAAAKAGGVQFLEEGNHEFKLRNGASLRLYASPYTPAKWTGRAYQYTYEEGHEFAIADNTQIVVTYGPPRGILDYTDGNQRAGCPQLYTAVAQTRPLIHCFGHIHEAWGCKFVHWKEASSSSTGTRRSARLKDSPHNDMDADKTVVLEQIQDLFAQKGDNAEVTQAKAAKRAEYERLGYYYTSHCAGDARPITQGKQTLILNASYDYSESKKHILQHQWPFVVDIELPIAKDGQKPCA